MHCILYILLMTLRATHSLKVGVIGGGACGLVTARILSRNGFTPIVLEQDSKVGGVWCYKEGDTTRPMYRGLRTNLPREIMGYREKPWSSNGPGSQSYVTHRDVLEYLNDYKEYFDLDKYISYDSKVTQLTVLTTKNGAAASHDDWPKIQLEWQCHKKDFTEIFDAVCICNGHYAKASSPTISGIDLFTGRILHSVEYDDPTAFKDETVLCIGARASGSDLAREISQHAKHVYLSDSTADESQTMDRVTLVPRTTAIVKDNKVQFANDCPLNPKVDTVIFCSGYDYSFPFINEKSNLELVVGQRRVMPLYKQLWHADYPSVAFLGLPHSVVPFPLFELQAEAVLNVLLTRQLPPLQVRMKAAKEDAVRGGPKATGRVEDTHYLGDAQWEYCREMAKMADLYSDKMENYIATNQAIYEHAGGERGSLFPGGPDVYRSTCYIRDEDNQSFQVTASEMGDAFASSSLPNTGN